LEIFFSATEGEDFVREQKLIDNKILQQYN